MMANIVHSTSRRLLPAVLAVAMAVVMGCGAASALLGPSGGRVGSEAPEFKGMVNWVNSEHQTMEQRRREWVTVDFRT